MWEAYDICYCTKHNPIDAILPYTLKTFLFLTILDKTNATPYVMYWKKMIEYIKYI